MPSLRPRHDAYAAFRLRDFRYYLTGNIIATVGTQMQDVAVGWQLYERTHSALALGLVGLVQVGPIIALTLPAGHASDRFERRRVLMVAELMLGLCAAGLAAVSLAHGPVLLMYACLLLSGTARAFQGPARSSLLPQLVPRELFSSAVTWYSGGWQLASVLGPALGGAVIALTRGATLVYILNAVGAVAFLVLLAMIEARGAVPAFVPASWESLLAGIRFVGRTPILLATITLDLFAVLLGGATTLLPIYAKDILRVGPTGLGWMLAAPSFGAVIMALALAHRPPMRRAGRSLVLAVIGFGAATMVFGLSRWFPLSLLALLVAGAFDNVSVVVRSTLVQLLTPDEMRGRVSAVNSVFVGTSNELGGFESGSLAALVGPVASVTLGGIGTIIAVMVIARIWPQLRTLGPLVDPSLPEETAALAEPA